MKEYIKKRKAELEKLTEGFITDELQDEIYARQDELNRISRQLEPPVKPEIVEIEETELFDKEVLIGGDLGYANKTRTKAITISDYGDGYRIRQYVSNGDMDWQRVGNIPMQLPVEPACKWILVNGRLPEVDKRVLVYVEDYHIDKDGTDTDRILFGYLRSSGKIKPDRCFGDFNVTKWMPIPKP
ncbi:MAG: DUF551 domain-containing protein [Ignavibacteriales bacterium]|nr:DUF551 domain-containing protein [Ignavibacteriales bacterium]